MRPPPNLGREAAKKPQESQSGRRKATSGPGSQRIRVRAIVKIGRAGNIAKNGIEYASTNFWALGRQK